MDKMWKTIGIYKPFSKQVVVIIHDKKTLSRTAIPYKYKQNAGGGTRTHNPSLGHGSKPCAYANSATPADE